MTKATLNAILALTEAIRALGEVPSGHLYANVMGHMSLDVYNSYIDAIVRTGLVTRSNHLLTWAGPVIEQEAGR